MVEETLGVHGVCFNYPLMQPNLSAAEITVVAAVIEREGQLLIGQRKRGASRHALKWEFPGGKVEAGESPRDALQRELREELDIEAVIGKEMAAYDVRYGSGPLTHLFFYHVTSFSGEPRNLDFEQIVWERPHRLASYDFLEGDLLFLRLLASKKTATGRTEE
jgi:8-oxo-dGTP diphosphatase